MLIRSALQGLSRGLFCALCLVGTVMATSAASCDTVKTRCTAEQLVCGDVCVTPSDQTCQLSPAIPNLCGACQANAFCASDTKTCVAKPLPDASPPDASPPDGSLPDGSLPDGPVDAGGCGPNKPFTKIVEVAGLAGSATSTDSNITLSSDELSAYYSSDRAVGSTSHIYFATRTALTAPFGAGAEVTSLSDSLGERWASQSASGLFVVIERNSKLYEASRAAKADPWGATVLPPELNEDAVAFPLTTGSPHLMPDGNTLYFSRLVISSFDVFKTTRSGGTWNSPVPVSELNVPGVNDSAPTLTPDALTIYFGSSRNSGDAGAGARSSVWVATRASVNDAFGAPRKVTELDQGTEAFPSWVSDDNCRLYFSKKVDLGGSFPAYRSYVASQ
jgi:hypothetical protein